MQRNHVLAGPPPRSGAHGRLTPLHIMLCAALCAMAAGCQTKLPPTGAEIQKEALANIQNAIVDYLAAREDLLRGLEIREIDVAV